MMVRSHPLLLLSLVGLSTGFQAAVVAPRSLAVAPRTSGGTVTFGAACDDNDDVAPGEVTRRAALVTGAAAVAASTSPSVSNADEENAPPPPPFSSSFGQKKAPPLEKQVKAIENANYIGGLTRKVYEPDSSGDPAKHLPQVTVDADNNLVMSVPHVMTEEHYIQFMWLKDAKTEDVVLVKALPPTDPSPPTLKARVPSGVTLRPYLFCNLHGLWKGEEFTVA